MWIIVILVLFMAQMITVLFVEYRNPSKTIAWLTIMIVIPIVGCLLYYFIAKSYKHQKHIRQSRNQMSVETRAFLAELAPRMDSELQLKQQYPRMYEYLESLSDAPMTSRNQVTVYADCEKTYEAMLAAMRAAVDHIHVQFYTIRSDRVGLTFQQLLIAKSLAGVKVRVIVDGVGSYHLDRKFILEMKQAGIEMTSFLPPFINFFDKRVNYRNHRKIVVIDGKVGFIGGMNIGEEYVGGNKKLGQWRDTHLKLMGDAVYYIQHIFSHDWKVSTGQSILELPQYYPKHRIHTQQVVQIISNGPDQTSKTILEMFFTAISAATSSVLLTSPYFIPDISIIMALKTAAKCGVDVRLILPFKADSFLVHCASLSYMEEMLQAGVKCYLYQEGFIHAKVLIIDKFMATVGTANMDMRSFFSNFELNAMLFDPETIATLLRDFQVDQENSTLLNLHDVQNRSRLQRTKEIGARLLSPLL